MLALTDVTANTVSFKRKAKQTILSKFSEYWRRTVESDSSRLLFYKSVKSKHEFEKYLNIPLFEHRKAITKVRCSDHPLQIETGRHRDIPRDDRLCRLCPLNVVETEEHFLTSCTFFYRYKPKYDLVDIIDAKSLMLNTEHAVLGSYLSKALLERKKIQRVVLP